MEEYLTVNEISRGEYTEKRSKFLSALYPCKSETQAAEILAKVKSDNFGANHNVYALVLRDKTVRFSDDGEPHGTGGKPVLDVLSGSEIKDALLVVTRYFGGVLLGTGGLARAYSTAAKNALDAAKRVKMCESVFYSISLNYSLHTKFVNLLNQDNAKILKTDFADSVNLSFVLPKSAEEKLLYDINETFSSKITPVFEKNGDFSYEI